MKPEAYEEVRERLALCQGVLDEVEEEYQIDDEFLLRSLSEASGALNTGIARMDAVMTGGTTKFMDPQAEKARRVIRDDSTK